MLDNLCGSRGFTRLPKLISKFQDNNGTEKKAKIKSFIAKTQHDTHDNHIKACMVCVNVICCRLGSSISQNPLTTVFIWDNGLSFGLTPF